MGRRKAWIKVRTGVAATTGSTLLAGFAGKRHGLASRINNQSLSLRWRADIYVRVMASRVKVEWDGNVCHTNDVVISVGCMAVR